MLIVDTPAVKNLYNQADVALYFSLPGANTAVKYVKLGTYVVGREVGCDIQIQHGSISRHHCKLVLGEKLISVQDLGSTNGTILNTEVVEFSEVEMTDRVLIGEIGLSFSRISRINAVTRTLRLDRDRLQSVKLKGPLKWNNVDSEDTENTSLLNRLLKR